MKRTCELFDDGDTRIDLVIGTHALFQGRREFDDLAMHHRRRAAQIRRRAARGSLLAKGRDPHLLAMTATPIPRSLAHAVFGDLDLTVIREKPPGRKPIRTFLRDRSAAPKVYRYVRDRVARHGEQAYFVYPMVEASEAVAGRKNVTDSAAALANGPSRVRVGILHGRMDDTTKDQTMQRFAAARSRCSARRRSSRSGLDVSNATIMVIESPEVFGLSQLHQLRGRVGRGSADSMCILLAGYGLTEDAEERLNSFAGRRMDSSWPRSTCIFVGPASFWASASPASPSFALATSCEMPNSSSGHAPTRAVNCSVTQGHDYASPSRARQSDTDGASHEVCTCYSCDRPDPMWLFDELHRSCHGEGRLRTYRDVWRPVLGMQQRHRGGGHSRGESIAERKGHSPVALRPGTPGRGASARRRHV